MRSMCFVFDRSLYNWYLRIFSADHLRQAWSWPRTFEIHNQSAGDDLNQEPMSKGVLKIDQSVKMP